MLREFYTEKYFRSKNIFYVKNFKEIDQTAFDAFEGNCPNETIWAKMPLLLGDLRLFFIEIRKCVNSTDNPKSIKINIYLLLVCRS